MAAGSKRGQGEGGLFYLRERDRWAFEIDLGIVDGKRKRMRRTFKKRQEAARALAAATAVGKGCGILARNEVEAQRYTEMGYLMIGLGSDQGLLAKASDELVARYRALEGVPNFV